MKRGSPSKRGGNGGVVLGVAALAAAFFSIPFAAHYAKRDNLHTSSKALNATQVRRGPYLNTGSRDAGADPDWDAATHTYHGRDRRRRRATPADADQQQQQQQ